MVQEALAHAEALPLEALMAAAAELRDVGHRHITFSPKVFIPLTRLCRDRHARGRPAIANCHAKRMPPHSLALFHATHRHPTCSPCWRSCGYCTFATPPAPGRRAFMTLSEVLEVARLGAEQGCTEALFTLGDKPEALYPEAAAELAAMGYRSTLEYVAAAAGAVLRDTGLLPHVNAGGREEQSAGGCEGGGFAACWPSFRCPLLHAAGRCVHFTVCRGDGSGGAAGAQGCQRQPGPHAGVHSPRAAAAGRGAPRLPRQGKRAMRAPCDAWLGGMQANSGCREGVAHLFTTPPGRH